MSKKSRKNIVLFLIFSAIYILIIGRWGYELGRNDQMQTLAYAKMISDNSLYQKDFYLQEINKAIPNERYVFSLFLSFFAKHLNFFSLLFHYSTSMFLFWGLYRISSLYIKNEILKYLVAPTIFIPLYMIFIGGCEIYYPTFFVSIFVKTIGIWGIFFFFKRKVFFKSFTFYYCNFFSSSYWLTVVFNHYIIIGIKKNIL